MVPREIKDIGDTYLLAELSSPQDYIFENRDALECRNSIS